MSRQDDWTFVRPGGWEREPPSGIAWTADLPRLPLGALIRPGESFGSWVDRLADENRLSRTDTWIALGLTKSSQQQPPAYGVALHDGQLATIAAATGEPLDAIQGSLLARFAATAVPLEGLDLAHPDTVQAWSAMSWVYVWQSHACPQCLADSDGVWQLTWKLPWSFMCPIHDAYLVGTCPTCGFRLQSYVKDARQRHVCVGAPAREPRPTVKGRPRRRRADDDICGTLVAGMKSHVVYDDIAAGVQEDLRSLLEPDAGILRPHLMSVLDETGRSPTDAFRDLRTTVQLALHLGAPTLVTESDGVVHEAFDRHCWRRDQMVPRRGVDAAMSYRTHRRAPTDPLLAAAALRIAFPLALGDRATVREAAEKFVGAVEDQLPRGRDRWWHVLKFLTLPSCIAEEIRRARDRVTFAGLAELDGRARLRRNAPAVVPHGADLVPALCWPSVYQDFAPLMPNWGWREPALRYVSLGLVRVLGDKEVGWEQAAHGLGLSSSVVAQCRKHTRYLRESGHGEVFTALLASVAATLANSNVPVNYGQRRRSFAGWTDVASTDWLSFCAEAGWNPGSKLVRRRRRWIAAWVWATLTGGDWHHAPSLNLPALEVGPREVLSNDYRNFVKTRAADLSVPLDKVARQTLRRRQLPGPVSWAPVILTDV